MADPTVYQSNYTQAQIDSVPGLSLWISQKERWDKVGTSVPNPGGRGAGSHVIDYANSGISDQINNAVANPADFVKTALTQNLVQSAFQSQFGFNYGENPRNSLSYITIDPDIIKSQVSYLQQNAPNLLPQIQTDANASFQQEANYANSTGDSGIFGGIAAFFDNNLLSAVMIIVAIVAPEVIPALGALVTGDTAAAAAIMDAGASAAAAGTSVASAVAAAVPVDTSVTALTAIGQASVAAASTAIAGGNLTQIAESAALAGGSSVAGGEISNAVTPTVGNVAGAGITGAATGAGVAAITGQDIGSAALTGALKGAASSEVKDLTSSPTTATISGGSNVIPVEGMPGSYINPLGQSTDSAGNILSTSDSGVNATAPVYPTTAEADAARATVPAGTDPEAATSLPYQGLNLASNAQVTGVDTSTGKTVVQITQPSPGQADTNIVYYATYPAGDPGNASDSKPIMYSIDAGDPGNIYGVRIDLKGPPTFDQSGNLNAIPAESPIKTSSSDTLSKYISDTYGIGSGAPTSTSTPVVDSAPNIGPIPSEFSPSGFVNSSGTPINQDGSQYVAPVVTTPVTEAAPVEVAPVAPVDTTSVAPVAPVVAEETPVVTQEPPDTKTSIVPNIGPIPSEFSPTKFVDSSGAPVNQDGSPYVAPVETAPAVQPAPSPVAESTPVPAVEPTPTPVASVETTPVAPVETAPIVDSTPAPVVPVETAPVVEATPPPVAPVVAEPVAPVDTTSVETAPVIAPNIGPIPSEFSPTKFIDSSGNPINQDGSPYVAPAETVPVVEAAPIEKTPIETVPAVTEPVVPVEAAPVEPVVTEPAVTEPVATSEPIASVTPVETAPVTAVEDKPDVATNIYGTTPTVDTTTTIAPNIGPIPSEFSPTGFIDSVGNPINQDGSLYVENLSTTAPVVETTTTPIVSEPAPDSSPTPEPAPALAPVVPIETTPIEIAPTPVVPAETAPVVPVETAPIENVAPVATEAAPVVTQEPTDTTGGTYGSIPTPDATTNIIPDIGPIPSEYSPTKFIDSSGNPVNEDGSIYVASPVVTAPIAPVDTAPAPAPELTPTPAPAPELTPVPVTPVETSPVVTQGPADTTDTAGGTYGTTPIPDTTTVTSPADTAVDSTAVDVPSLVTPVQATPVTEQPVIDTTVTEPFVSDTTASTAPTTGDTTDTMGGTYGFIPPDTTTVISPPDIGAIESAFSPSGFVNSSGTPVNKDGSIYVAAAPVTDTPVASVDTVAPLAPIEPEGGTYTAEPTPSSGGGGTYTVTPSEDTTTKTADIVDTGPSIGSYTGDTTPESTKIDPTNPLIKTPKEEDSASTTTITPGSSGVGFKIPTIPGSVQSSPGSSALLAALGASLAPDKELGDVESTTGGKKKLVWNEASLRNLQDALGI